MSIRALELSGFKSFAKKTTLEFSAPISAVVGPNGSGKSNVAEALRFVLGEQSMKSLRSKKGEDLIFNGSRGVPRANRASVKATFDNRNRLLPLDFDEITIGRTVHRDATNEYTINGTSVRLKDVQELLARANIGSSGHAIISQGEADRLLQVSPTERREIIEDALGLKIYRWQKKESLKKLDKTEENLKEIRALKREIQPHLKFLERQVQKIEEAEVVRQELIVLSKEYFCREELYQQKARSEIEAKRSRAAWALKDINDKILTLQETQKRLQEAADAKEKDSAKADIEKEIEEIRSKEQEYAREQGKIEAEISLLSRYSEPKRTGGERSVIEITTVRTLTQDIEQEAEQGKGSEDAGEMKSRFSAILDRIGTFRKAYFTASNESTASHHEQEERGQRQEMLRGEQGRLAEELSRLRQEREHLAAKIKDLALEETKELTELTEVREQLFAAESARKDEENILNSLTLETSRLEEEMVLFKGDLSDAGFLLGKEILSYAESAAAYAESDEPRAKQAERHRTLERLRARFEEMKPGSTKEIMREYEETKERDAFLEREINDLEQSRTSLLELIETITGNLRQEFASGLTATSREFGNFFSLMFGGGSAELVLTKNEEAEEGEEDQQEGVEIALNLPHKRVKGLQTLSGGERSLVSVALLFAMSQINPPPFIVLDETDAALDEANSRRYAELIRKLSERTQLVIITHNRETMSHAGLLYGVTMGMDGCSQLLSIKLENALRVAK